MGRLNLTWLGLLFVILLGRGSAQAAEPALFQPLPGTFHPAPVDTNRLLSDQPLKSPMGAVYRSALLPGWGQVYTEHYLKAAVAFSVNSFLLYNALNYHRRWRDTGNRDFQAKRNLFTWYFGLSYFLTMVDAYVDAYLYKFDEAIEISQHFENRDGKWFGTVQFTFHF